MAKKTKKKTRKGSIAAGRYTGMLNGVSGAAKKEAKSIRKAKGLTAAVAYLRKQRAAARKKSR